MSNRSHQSVGKPAPIVAFGRLPNLVGCARSTGFFCLFFAYLWRVVDVRLIYSAAGMVSDFPVFFRGEAFFRPFLSYPGGLAEYVGAFLAQWFTFPWGGALVVTLQAWLLAACSGAVLDAAGASRLGWVRFAFPIGLLVICSHYAYHFVAVTAMSIALIATCMYIIVALRLHERGRHAGCAVLFAVLSLAVYYAAAGGYLLFAVACAGYELLHGRWRLGAASLASAVAVPYVVGVLIFRVSVEMAFLVALPLWSRTGFTPPRDVPGMVSSALVLVLPVTLCAAGLWRLAAHRWRRSEAEKKSKRAKQHGPGAFVRSIRSLSRCRPVVRWVVGATMLLAVTAGAAMLSYDGVRKATFQVHCYACRRMWPEVLQVARGASRSLSTMNAVNRALYHSGRLGAEMFAWPQHADALLVSGQDQDMTFWTKFDTQMDLGLVNAAHKNYTECLEVYGAHPLILERLALANLVKGNMGGARIYLGALSKTLLQGRWARDCLARLASDPTLATDERVAQWRSVCMRQDAPTIFAPAEVQLQTLLKENERNRMAFEYLMSGYMLNRQLDKFAAHLDRLDAFGYEAFPRHYEEAILVYAYATRQSVFLHGRQIQPQSRQRIEQFSQTFNRHNKDRQAALRELAAGYGDSYFFFNLYGLSGVKR
jgi:hypothetical protein